MLVPLLLIVIGLVLVVWGADRFVVGAAATAHHLGVSPLLIGLTIVGFGTSAPEILVAVNAALDGNPGLALGNALGSNIANIGLIIGAATLLVPLTIRSQTLRREMRVLVVVTLLAIIPFTDGTLTRVEGFILLFGLIALLGVMLYLESRARRTDPLIKEWDREIRSDLSKAVAIVWLTLGLLVLLAGARILVIGAVDIAMLLGISDLVIGLTIVAVGTSLPELAATVAAAAKDEDDLAIGNIIGSNMYNLLAVVGIAAIIEPTPLDDAILQRDYPVMMLLTAALFLIAYNIAPRTDTARSKRIPRWTGTMLLLAFIAYQSFIAYSTLT
ncbi:MAG: calcium/sodium antiporter [Gammaproteobacteria bacterium]|nr:calcium/sodium antiporter [Gammaproteobacteria bacterium]